MPDTLADALNNLVLAAAEEAKAAGAFTFDALPDRCIEVPSDTTHGDFASPLAMQLARQAHKNPFEIAEAIVQHLHPPPDLVRSVGVVRPGFINIVVASSAKTAVIRTILTAGAAYGRHTFGGGARTMVEFVSSNPTGPLTVGHGRQAVIGDVLANLFDACGYDVAREYYFNDAGGQMDMLGRSVQDRYEQLCDPQYGFPSDDRYQGEYIIDIAQAFRDEHGDAYRGRVGDADALGAFRAFGAGRMIASITEDLDRFGIHFDRWFSEASLHEAGTVRTALKMLTDLSYVYEQDGARWFRSSAFGDEKDRVVVRSNGELTYLAADIGYHWDKRDRGFQHVINVWGADHHGYVARVQAACRAFDFPEDFLECVLHQMVNFRRDGQEVKMSTRRGDFVTLMQLVDEVGLAVTRYFYIMRSPDAQLVFDLDLAKAESQENPVYYIQYGHARIRSIFAKAREAGLDTTGLAAVDLSPLTDEGELALVQQLAGYPRVVAGACRKRGPHLIAAYILETVGAFHTYYTRGNNDPELRVVTADVPRSVARLALVEAVRQVIANALGLLGIDAPERM